MEKGLIFNVQRHAVHDGSGIRTLVFLKGCPLACPWCCNPESRGPVSQTVWRKFGKEETIGKWSTAAELVSELEKDELFYRTSGGGVTFSGGEPLLQADFVLTCLKELNDLGIHTAIETTGCTDPKALKSLLPFLDLVLFDLKIMDDQANRNCIGINMANVRDNFSLVLAAGVEVMPRFPLIPGYTITDENLNAVVQFLKHHQLSHIHLLPFHQYGRQKYDYLGWSYEMKEVDGLGDEKINQIKDYFKAHQIATVLYGLA